jgi:class 3 adenylate cyclase/tetratricopeptide (TPR) repeat protein
VLSGAADPGDGVPAPDAEFRKTITLLFADVVGSTALGEWLDPERLSNVLREYFTAMKAVIESHGGTVAKFIGDSVVGAFGLPELHEDDALRAVRAALEMQVALAALNTRLECRWRVTLEMRTGINTGPTVGAGLATEQNFVAGDAANVAARLQQQAAAGEILLGEATFRLVAHAVDAEPLRAAPVVGRAAPVAAFRLRGILPGAEALPRRLETTMIGRTRELAELEQAFERVAAGPNIGLTTVVGEAGIGKSLLVHEFLDRVRERALVLQGRCLPYGEGITYWPLAEAIRQAAGITERDASPMALAKLEALLAGADGGAAAAERIAELLGMSPPQIGSEELPWAVRSLVGNLTTARPLVLVLDDIQWAEPALLDLVEGIRRELRGAPVLIVCLARPELLERLPDWPADVSLTRLSRAESDRLLGALLGDSVPPAQTRDRIVAAAEGNPFYLEQLVSMLVDEGYLGSDDESSVPTPELDNLPLPPTVHALLAARLDQLEPSERALIGRAAVVGQVFYQGAIEALAPDESRETIERALHGLMRKDLVQWNRSDFVGERAYGFLHLLVRDAAYESLTRSDRAVLHERVALWIERVAGERVAEYEEIVAYHLEQAHDHLLALGAGDELLRELAAGATTRLVAAGRRARDLGNPAAAIGLLSRAGALAGGHDGQAPELLVELGQTFVEAGRFDEAQAALLQAVEAATAAGDLRAKTKAELVQLQVRWHVDPTLANDTLETAAASATQTFARLGDNGGAAQAWRLLFFARYARCRMAAALDAIEHALEHALRANDPDHVRDRMRLLDALTFGPMPSSQALARAEETRTFVEGNRWGEANLSARMARLLAIRGEYEHARDAMSQAVAYYEDVGALVKRAMDIAEGLGWYVEGMRGEWQRAAGELRRGFDLLQSIGAASFAATVDAYQAHAAYALGQDLRAQEFADRSAAAAAEDDIGTQVLWRGAWAKARARSGDVSTAEHVAREAVALALTTDVLELQAAALLDLGEVVSLDGRLGDAREAVTEALRLYRVKEHLPGVDRAQTALAALSSKNATFSPAGSDSEE